uniref:Uncharacterized protein n=1 Tax=Vespula pensylvanica TaxID=30213 RepID=A0A834P2G4_VESPE|nr:hypothetical protein H0235_008101 [Vespula pensylvanica]
MSTAPMRLLETWKLSRRHSWSTKQVYDMVRLSSVPVSERFLRTVRPQLCKALPGRINQSPPWRPDSSKFVASFQPSSVWIGIPLACGLQRSRPGAVYLPAGFLIRYWSVFEKMLSKGDKRLDNTCPTHVSKLNQADSQLRNV